MTDAFDPFRYTPEAPALKSLTEAQGLLPWLMTVVGKDPCAWIKENWSKCRSPKELYFFAATMLEATDQNLVRINVHHGLNDLVFGPSCRSGSYGRILVSLARKAVSLENPDHPNEEHEHLLSLVDQMHRAYHENLSSDHLLKSYLQQMEQVPGDNANWVRETGSLSLRAIDVVRRKVSYPGGIHDLFDVLKPVGTYVLCAWIREIVPWKTLEPCVDRAIRYLHQRDSSAGL